MKTRQYLTPYEVARILMVSPVTVRQWASKGLIEAKNTPGGHRRFSFDEVKRFAKERGIDISKSNTTKKILIVDDDTNISTLMKNVILERVDDAVVEITNNGFEAGRIVQSIKPDIIFLDLMMPGIDGFAVCRLLKTDIETRSIRIIAMTGYPTTENINRIKQAGAEMCLEKPFNLDELVDIISSTTEQASTA